MDSGAYLLPITTSEEALLTLSVTIGRFDKDDIAEVSDSVLPGAVGIGDLGDSGSHLLRTTTCGRDRPPLLMGIACSEKDDKPNVLDWVLGGKDDLGAYLL